MLTGSFTIDTLWGHALAVVPLAVLALLICRCLPCRPVTRHGLWLIVLAWFVVPLVLPHPPALQWPSASSVADEPVATPIAAAPIEPAPIVDAAMPTPTPIKHDTDAARADRVPRFATIEPTQRRSPRRAERESSPRVAVDSRVTSPARAARPTADAPSWLPQAQRSDGPSAVRSEPSPIASEPETPAVAAETESPEPIDITPITTTFVSAWRAWVAGLARVRDAIAALPTMPTSVWLTGIATILLWYAVGVTAFLWRLRRARPAPHWVRREVRRVARRFKLRSVPETLLIDERISPLVWGLGRTRLVLPTKLWQELDPVGRSAILCHELAHLRRRDHWVRWFELAVASICWWHPLVWWVRRRIHDEADQCCDAWVTWLMPTGRREYAQALLRTQQSIGRNDRSMSTVGMGVTSAGARNLARRLTMVMTKSGRPRQSLTSLSLACVLAVTGWAVMPAFSCPPDKAKPTAAPKSTIRVTSPARVATTADGVVTIEGDCIAVKTGDCATTCEVKGDHCNVEGCHASANPIGVVSANGSCAAVVSGDPVSSPAVVIGSDGNMHWSSGPDASVYGIATSEPPVTLWADAIALADDGSANPFIVLGGDDDDSRQDRIAKLEAKLKALQAELSELARESRAPAANRPHGITRFQAPRAPSAPRPPQPPAAPTPPAPPTPPTPPAPPSPQSVQYFFGPSDADSDEVIICKYDLPAGKAEALNALMVREDVPVLVRPLDDGVEVHGTARQHAIFSAFIKLIHPDAKLPDVPSAPGANFLYRSRSDLQSDDARRRYEDAIKSHERSRRAAADRSRELREMLERNVQRTRSDMRSREDAPPAADLEAQTRELQAAAAELTKKADELSAQADRMGDLDQRRELEAKSREIERQSRQLETKARKLEAESRKIERETELRRRHESASDRDTDSECEAESLVSTETQQTLCNEIAQRISEAIAAGNVPQMDSDQIAEMVASLRNVDAASQPEVREAIESAMAALHESQPALRVTIAEALSAAAQAMRTKTDPQVRDALRQAARAIRNDATPAVKDALEQLSDRLGAPTTQMIMALLEHAADTVEVEVTDATREALDRVAEMLDAQAQQLNEPSRAR